MVSVEGDAAAAAGAEGDAAAAAALFGALREANEKVACLLVEVSKVKANRELLATPGLAEGLRELQRDAGSIGPRSARGG
jgi:hypothetical protein